MKKLLLQDLCARLPYRVKGIITYDKSNTTFIIEGIDNNVLHLSDVEECCIEDFKPYLRPMSSMTDEEKKEYDNFLFDNLEREDVIGYEDKAFGIDVIMRYRSWEVVQWLLEHHLDFNGLIDVYGLALEAPKGMYD